jgi:spore germination protein KB
MNIEKGKISALQLILMAAAVFEGPVYTLSFSANLAKNNIWLIILISMLIAVPFGYIYALLAKRFPGLNLVDIHQIIYGRYVGTAVSLYFLSYFLMVFTLTTRDVGDFYSTFFMWETPPEVIMIVFLCASAFGVWNGIEVLCRIAPFSVMSISLVIIGTALVLLPKLNFANFLPIGEIPLTNLIHSTQIITEIPFGITMLIYLPLAFTVNDQRRTVRTFFSGLLLGATFFLATAIRNTAVLGGAEGILFSPSFQTARLISIGFLSRLDILFAFGHTFAQFSLNSTYFYISVLLFAQILGLRTYAPLVFPLGCIAAIMAMIVYPSPIEHLQSVQNVEIMYFFPVMFIFPPLSLLIAKIRNLPRKGCL